MREMPPLSHPFALGGICECTEVMHVVIVGCGRVGSGLANQLSEAGESVTIVDRNTKAFRRLSTDFAGTKLVGMGFDRETLEQAGAQGASSFAAVTSGDNSNILSARIAKESFAIPNVVARIYDPRRAAIFQRLGIATVATVAWTTDQIQRSLGLNNTSIWTDQSGSLSLIERTITTPWCGQKISSLGDGQSSKLVAVSRAGHATIASPDIIGQEGDVLHLLVQSDDLRSLDQLLATGPAH
jgi:trk system potassium uptake protein